MLEHTPEYIGLVANERHADAREIARLSFLLRGDRPRRRRVFRVRTPWAPVFGSARRRRLHRWGRAPRPI